MEKKGKKGNEFSADSDAKNQAGLFDKMICEVTIFVKHETDEEQAMKCLKDRKISCLELQVTTLEKKSRRSPNVNLSLCQSADRQLNLNSCTAKSSKEIIKSQKTKKNSIIRENAS